MDVHGKLPIKSIWRYIINMKDIDDRSLYEKNIQDRTKLRYVIGLLVRWKQHLNMLRLVG